MSAQLAAALPSEHLARFQALAAELGRLSTPALLILNRNRQVLISLRGGGTRPLVLSIHAGILAHARACADLPNWVSHNGRGSTPAIRDALDTLGREVRRAQVREPHIELTPLGGPLDLEPLFREVHARYFAGLSCPVVAWSRRGPAGRRRHLRFASYRRQPPLVLVNQRLNQPWVAIEFVRFVLYHELCHHAQACDPRPGETAHSARFRARERTYPDYARILAWERQHLDHFLSFTPPFALLSSAIRAS